jgi:hypothetical protein
MSDEKTKVSRGRTARELARELGIKRIEAFRRADLTPELREKVGLTPEDELQLAAVVELHGLGLPLEVAEALVASRALGSASELAALTADEVERLLSEAPVKRLLPGKLEVNRESIDLWLERVTPLTAEEDAPAREAVAEEEAPGAAGDEDTSPGMEDLALNRKQVEELLEAFRTSWQRGEATVQSLTPDKGGQVDAQALREALLALQTGIGDVMERFTARDPGGFAAVDEEGAETVADEGLDTAKDIQRLELELKHIETRLDALRLTAEGGDEEQSPAVATEDDGADTEAPVRGE